MGTVMWKSSCIVVQDPGWIPSSAKHGGGEEKRKEELKYKTGH